MRRAATAYAVVPRSGKLTRKCVRCDANPGVRCWKLRPGQEDGVDRVPLVRQDTPHPER